MIKFESKCSLHFEQLKFFFCRFTVRGSPLLFAHIDRFSIDLESKIYGFIQFKTPTKSNPQCMLLARLHIWQMYVQNNNKRAEKQKKIVMQKRRKVYAHTISGIQKNGKENGNNDDSDDGGTNETQVIKLMFIYTITPNAHTHTHINTNRSATGV